jgi:hypothetical protein
MKSEAELFAEWVAQNHYHLFNVDTATRIHYWYNEDGVKTTGTLYQEFLNQFANNK